MGRLMNALDKTKVLKHLIDEGEYIFGEILDATKAKELFKKMLEKRSFGRDLFLTEQEYVRQENHFNANPTTGRNFLNSFATELEFVEKDFELQEMIKAVLGQDYEIVIKKAICGVPFDWLPDWVARKVNNINVANLGAYIKPPYRDITYFRGIDYHQDIIDWPQGKTDLDPASFITLYVYLHDVGVHDSPLYLLPQSHKLGATLFPHKLTKQTSSQWCYQDHHERHQICNELVLTGKAGYVGMWHNCTLHGTQPINNVAEKMRISLRYLLSKSKKNTNRLGIDVINESIDGDLCPVRTRKDIDDKGIARLRGNTINR